MIRSEATALVDVSAHSVWDVLTDASNYEAWDSGVSRVFGQIRDGSTINVKPRLGRTGPIHVRVGPWTMRWEHRGPLGLFKAVRTCTLLPGDGQCQLTVHEEYLGPRIVLGSTFMSAAEPVLEAFVRAAKSRAELLGRTWHGKPSDEAPSHTGHPPRRTS